ncbi:Protein NAS-38 [Aphelenchoides avenae]|nr:Protein NAS-38 [Aphelenchus avenae]
MVTLIGPAACNCGLWSEWQGPCNQLCGGCGKRSRRRICQQENCQKEEKRTCNFNACPSGTNFLFNNGEFHVLWKGCCVGLFRADDVCSGLDSNQNTFLKIFTSLLSAMDHGNSTTAAVEIPAGQNVVEDPTNILVVTKRSLHCTSCARLLQKGPRRCSECGNAQFCRSCYDDAVPLHRLECGLEAKIVSVAVKHGNPGDALRLRMALRMLATLDADELHTSLQEETHVRKDASVKFDNSSLYAFISLECAAKPEVNLRAVGDFVRLVLPRLQQLKPLKSTRTDEEAETFWTKALRAALLRIPHNGYTIVPQENLSDNSLAPHSPYFPSWRLHEQLLYGVGLILESDAPTYGMDAPDEESVINGSTMVFRTSRDVMAGEELCDSYGPCLGVNTTEERKKFLRETYGFDCQCEACSSSEANELDSYLAGSKCVHCGELTNNKDVIVCQTCIDSKAATNDRELRDASEVNTFVNTIDWSRYEVPDMYRLFQIAQRYLECGHLLLEQAAHMTAYELILDCPENFWSTRIKWLLKEE